MFRFLAFITLLAAIAIAVAAHSQGLLRWPSRATAVIRQVQSDKWLDDLQGRNPRDAAVAAERLERLGAEALPRLRAVLTDPGAGMERRKAALKACVLLEHTAAPIVPDVAAHLRTRELTEEAAVALSFMGPAAFPQLREAVESGDPLLRREALRSLGKLKARAPLDAKLVVPLLVGGLSDDVPTVRAVAATYLGIIHEEPKQSVTALIAAVEDPDADVRRAAVTALGSFGEDGAGAVPVLRKATLDSDADVAREAGRALIRLAGGG